MATLFLDVDEVLADFTGAAAEAHGHTREELEEKREKGVWDICRVLDMEPSEFWKPIHELGAGFWLGLEPLPWWSDLVDLVDDRFQDSWYLLTSPCRGAECHYGKVQWIEKHFGTRFDRFFITPHKWIFGKNPGAILIDDSCSNIGRFNYAGGRGILFPHQSNDAAAYMEDPVSYIRGVL